MMANMKLWDFIKGAKRQLRTKMEFERLCEEMMNNSSVGRGVRMELDNEFYGVFGMSAYEVSEQIYVEKTGVHNQKHRPIY